MNLELLEKIKKGLEKNKSLNHIRVDMINNGYLNADIDEAIKKSGKIIGTHKKKKGITKYIIKDIFDRIGYGFGSQQYLNIFLYLTGGSYFLIGLINGIKAILSMVIATIIEEYSKVKSINKKTIGITGIIFGLCFILISYAVYLKSVLSVAAGILIGSISVVAYGGLYQKMFNSKMVWEGKKNVIGKLSYLGLLITSITLIISSYLLERFGMQGKTISFNLFDKAIHLKIYGYMLTLNAAAVFIILSGYILYFMSWKNTEEKVMINVKQETVIFFNRIKEFFKKIIKNKTIVTLMVSGIVIGLVQTLGSAYYAIFIFTNMASSGFGRWMNVAVVSVMAILSTLISPYITRSMAREYGKFPMLAFGAVLMAIMPVSYYYKPTILSISMGTIAGMIGASINGMAIGLIVRDNLEEKEMKTYFQLNSLITIVPYILLMPIGAFIAQKFGLRKIFLIIGIALLVITLPLYFYILILNHNKEKV